MISKLPKFTKSFYFIAGLSFLVWMLFIDSNDLVTQYKQSHKLGTLEAEQVYYQEKIKEVEAERQELLTNPELLEKFAREKYLMKKPEEDLFVLVEEEE